jgi:hypothetical protein
VGCRHSSYIPAFSHALESTTARPARSRTWPPYPRPAVFPSSRLGWVGGGGLFAVPESWRVVRGTLRARGAFLPLTSGRSADGILGGFSSRSFLAGAEDPPGARPASRAFVSLLVSL